MLVRRKPKIFECIVHLFSCLEDIVLWRMQAEKDLDAVVTELKADLQQAFLGLKNDGISGKGALDFVGKKVNKADIGYVRVCGVDPCDLEVDLTSKLTSLRVGSKLHYQVRPRFNHPLPDAVLNLLQYRAESNGDEIAILAGSTPLYFAIALARPAHYSVQVKLYGQQVTGSPSLIPVSGMFKCLSV